MTFEEIVHHRRSIRHYKNIPIDADRVKHCLQLATLAPNSSNLQLWEFYHITDPEKVRLLGEACLSQKAATTAQQLVVFVTRQDLYRQHAQKMMDLERANVTSHAPADKQQRRIKRWEKYYTTLVPFMYARFFGFMGLLRWMIANVTGLFRTIMYQVTESDMRIVVHKTCALAAQTFMLAMANEKYDTCAMEGFDSRKVKRILNLPSGAEVNMVVSCGIRDEEGVWGHRQRLPFEEVYFKV
ncbi:MAG: nitroreductase family protein [Chitinophagales bacterium]